MIVAAVLQFLVCFLILLWLLKKKTGEPFSKKYVAKCLIFGALSAILPFALLFALPIDKTAFFGMNPILSGFLTALIMAALVEEVAKYILFRLAIRKSGEARTWLDAILVSVMVAIGFTLLEDLTYLFGGGSILRALLPCHLLFGAFMGYFYGKARVTKQAKYDVLSLAVPILAHTLFDMFIIGLMSMVGDPKNITSLTEEKLNALPYASYLIPMLVCAIAIMILMVIAMLLTARKISLWSKNGEKQELLQAENI